MHVAINEKKVSYSTQKLLKQPTKVRNILPHKDQKNYTLLKKVYNFESLEC